MLWIKWEGLHENRCLFLTSVLLSEADLFIYGPRWAAYNYVYTCPSPSYCKKLQKLLLITKCSLLIHLKSYTLNSLLLNRFVSKISYFHSTYFIVLYSCLMLSSNTLAPIKTHYESSRVSPSHILLYKNNAEKVTAVQKWGALRSRDGLF